MGVSSRIITVYHSSRCVVVVPVKNTVFFFVDSALRKDVARVYSPQTSRPFSANIKQDGELQKNNIYINNTAVYKLNYNNLIVYF